MTGADLEPRGQRWAGDVHADERQRRSGVRSAFVAVVLRDPPLYVRASTTADPWDLVTSDATDGAIILYGTRASARVVAEVAAERLALTPRRTP